MSFLLLKYAFNKSRNLKWGPDRKEGPSFVCTFTAEQCSSIREKKKVWHNNYLGHSGSPLCRQAVDYLGCRCSLPAAPSPIGANAVILESDTLSEEVAESFTIFIEVKSDPSGRYLMYFPDKAEGGTTIARLAFAKDRDIVIPAHALHAKRLIGLRRPPAGGIHRGDSCQAFHVELRKLHERALKEYTRPAKKPKRKHQWSLGPTSFSPPYMLEK